MTSATAIPAGKCARTSPAWHGLLRTHARLTRLLDAELEQRHGLSLPEYDVLVQLEAAAGGSLRMADLADAVLLTRSGVTRLVDRLERRGLVARTRCPSDARGMHAVLTEHGRARLAEAGRTHADGVRRVFTDRLEPGDGDRLKAIWERLDDPRGGQ